MKKFLLVFLAGLLILLSGCEKPEKENKNEYETESVSTEKVFDAEKALSQLEVTEYDFNVDMGIYGNDGYLYLIIKNTSDFDLCVRATVKFYDENGEIVDVMNSYAEGVAVGTETVIDFKNKGFSTYEYELKAEQESSDDCVAKDLSYEIIEGKGKYIINVTNNGEKTADDVFGYLLLFDNKGVFWIEYGQFGDGIYSLDPNESISAEFEPEIDPARIVSYKFILTGTAY